MDQLVILEQLLRRRIHVGHAHRFALLVQVDRLPFGDAVPALDGVDDRRLHGGDMRVHVGQERQIGAHFRVHLFGGLRDEEVRRGVGAVVELGALHFARLVRPDEVVGQVQRDRVLLVGAGRLVDARQVVAVEHDGDRLVDRVEFLEELLGGLVGQLHALGVGAD